MRNTLRSRLLYIDKILIIIVLIKTIESGTTKEDMKSLAWMKTKQTLNRTHHLENNLDRRKSIDKNDKEYDKEMNYVSNEHEKLAREDIVHDITIPHANYINKSNKTASNNLSKFVNSTQLFENIMLHVNIKNSTYSNVYNRLNYANQSSIYNNSYNMLDNVEKSRRDTSKIRIHPKKSKTVIRSSDYRRPRPKKDIDKIHQIQSELNNDYYVMKDQGAEDIEYDPNMYMQNAEDDKLYNHKLDRSLFDRTNHNYNPNNPIHSINQLYTSFQSQDMSDYSTYNPIGNQNIGQNPMNPYFESSSIMPTFTTPRSYHDVSSFRKFPPGYYYPYMRSTTTTASPDYEYFEEEIQEMPVIEAKKRWSQPVSPYNGFRPLSKLSSGYGYGYSAPEYSHTGYGSTGPSYHSPPDYGHSGHGHSGHGHGHNHIPVITETIIHKPTPHKFDFKKLLMIALLKFGLSKLKWFLLLKLLLLKLLKLKFILFLLFLKIYLFMKFLKFLKFLKLLLIPLLLLPLLPLLLLAGLLLFLPVPVLAPTQGGTTSTFFGTGPLPVAQGRRRKRRDLSRAAFNILDQSKSIKHIHPDDAILLIHRILGAEEFLQRIVCDELKREEEESNNSMNVYR